jgi:hypothetical protein
MMEIKWVRVRVAALRTASDLAAFYTESHQLCYCRSSKREIPAPCRGYLQSPDLT